MPSAHRGPGGRPPRAFDRHGLPNDLDLDGTSNDLDLDLDGDGTPEDGDGVPDVVDPDDPGPVPSTERIFSRGRTGYRTGGGERVADLGAGAVLGGRFEIHGVVGRGGQATVYLATDRLRGHRVALKIVHPHLASDPAVRRRLQREVAAAAALQTETALVPHDVHELDGQIVLSMPFHPGQTLAERVATRGPLGPEAVRTLGLRIATALSVAHRAGVLHRDVTATNVLLGEPADAVLTDFGLSRTQGSTRSTGLLGTAGYAAPEVYAGERADPRSDLYGLGAVLYLAATGQSAFDARDPMGALKQQLDASFPPVRRLAKGVPADLADTIEALLRPLASERPQGAREVLDLLERRAAPEKVATVAAGHALPPGPWTVLVREREEDRPRRQRLRAEQGRGRKTADSEIARWGTYLVGQLRDALGIPAGDAATPEELLVRAVAEEAGLSPDAMRPPPTLLQRRFRLVDGTDEATANRLAAAADGAGFRAEVARVGGPDGALEWAAQYAWILYVVAWVATPALLDAIGILAIALNVALTLAVMSFGRSFRRTDPNVARTAIAYRADLAAALVPGVSLGAPAAAREPEAVPSRGTTLRGRADAALDALDASVASIPDLPEPARIDLRSTSRELRERALDLGEEIDRIEAAVPGAGAPEVEIAALRARLDRMSTLARAGDRVDAGERARLERAIEQHEADLQAAERLEARLAACTAQLLEIASTASRVRRELLSEADPGRSADELVGRLQRESQLVDDARREMNRRAQVGRKIGS